MSGIRLGPLDLLEPIGRGAWAEVWRARHRRLSLPVAVKILTAKGAADEDFVFDFRSEVRTIAALEHPGIVRLYDFGELDGEAQRQSEGRFREGSPFMVLELADGPTLDRADRPARWPEFRARLVAMLDALAHAHARGVIHRDLKPSNIIVVENAAGRLVGETLKLTDFGIARAMGTDTGRLEVAATRRHDEGVTGTPQFMAPEQIKGRWRDQGPWTDLYAVGCLAWEAATNAPPFDGDQVMPILLAHLRTPLPPFEPLFSVPEGFEGWLRRMLAKRPIDRFRRAADAAHALLALDQHKTNIQHQTDIQPKTDITEVIEFDPTEVVDFQPEDLASAEGRDTDPLGAFAVARTIAPRCPPPPESWPRPSDRLPPRHPLDTGLNLFGLRSFPIVGRLEARDLLWRALRQVWQTCAGLGVIVSGAAGCGKSRLVEWLGERGHELGVLTVLKAVHDAHGGDGDGLRPMLRRHLRCDGLGGEALLERVVEHLERHGADSAEERLALASLLDPRCSDGASIHQALDTRVFRFLDTGDRYRIIDQVLARLSAERPVLLWLDNVQWGADALSFAAWLLRRQREAPLPVLLVLSVRDEALGETEAGLLSELRARSDVWELGVGPLAAEERAQLVGEVLGLEPGLAARVDARAEGNPMFAIQLVSDWVQQGLLVPGDDGFALAPGAPTNLPDSLHTLWADRIERLLSAAPEEAGVALELAAVLGRTVSTAEWTAVCRRLNVPVAQDLVLRMLEQRLAVAAPGAPTESSAHNLRLCWSFGHPLLRESLERRASERGRLTSGHRAIVGMLRDQRPVDVERLAHHLIGAGEPIAALEPLLLGAARWIRAGELGLARALLRDREAILDAAAFEPECRSRVDGWLTAAKLDARAGAFEAADELANRAAAAAHHQGWVEPAIQARLTQVEVAQRTGRLAAAWAHAETAERWARRRKSPRLLGEALQAKAGVMRRRGAMEAAAAAYREALEVYEAAGDELQEAFCIDGLGEVACLDGRPEEAEPLLERARAIFERRDARLPLAHSTNTLGEVARHKGDLDRAEACYRESLRRYDGMGAVDSMIPRLNLGMVLLARGQPARARPVLERALEQLRSRHMRAFVGATHAHLMTCAAASGDWIAWDEHLSQATRVLAETGYVDIDVARSASEAGDLAVNQAPERAREAYHLSLSQWRGLGHPGEVARIEARLAAIR